MTNANAQTASLLRWIFLRDGRALTCDVSANGANSYDVSVVPHWDVASSVVERYDRASNALQRHAELASAFRDAGWMLIRETAERATAA